MSYNGPDFKPVANLPFVDFDRIKGSKSIRLMFVNIRGNFQCHLRSYRRSGLNKEIFEVVYYNLCNKWGGVSINSSKRILGRYGSNLLCNTGEYARLK